MPKYFSIKAAIVPLAQSFCRMRVALLLRDGQGNLLATVTGGDNFKATLLDGDIGWSLIQEHQINAAVGQVLKSFIHLGVGK